MYLTTLQAVRCKSEWSRSSLAKSLHSTERRQKIRAEITSSVKRLWALIIVKEKVK